MILYRTGQVYTDRGAVLLYQNTFSVIQITNTNIRICILYVPISFFLLMFTILPSLCIWVCCSKSKAKLCIILFKHIRFLVVNTYLKTFYNYHHQLFEYYIKRSYSYVLSTSENLRQNVFSLSSDNSVLLVLILEWMDFSLNFKTRTSCVQLRLFFFSIF